MAYTVAWYYVDHDSDTVYWCRSYSHSCSAFAEIVSRRIGGTVTAFDISEAKSEKELKDFPIAILRLREHIGVRPHKKLTVTIQNLHKRKTRMDRSQQLPRKYASHQTAAVCG